MIETYLAHLIPPAALRTTLYRGGEGEQGEIQIRDLEFKSHKIHDLRSIVLGANISIESCDLDTLWVTTEDDASSAGSSGHQLNGLCDRRYHCWPVPLYSRPLV